MIEALYFANMAVERLDDEKGIIYYSHDSIRSLYQDCLWESQYYEAAKDLHKQFDKDYNDDRRIL